MLQEIASAAGLANYIVGCITGLALLAAVAMRLFNRPNVIEDERAFLIGVGMTFAGWAAHQAYWLIWRIFFDAGASEVANWLAVYGGLFVLPAYFLIGLGTMTCIAVVVGLHGKVPLRMIFAGGAIWLCGFIVGLVF